MRHALKLLICILFLSFQKQVFSQKLSANQLLNDSISVVAANKSISKMRIGDISKKYIIVDLWATWCKPCIDNHKYLEDVYSRHSDSLSIITICGDTYKNFSRFNKNWDTKLVKALDTGNVFFEKYKVKIVPTLLLINTETGNVRVATGALMSEELFSGFSKGKTRLADSIPAMLDPGDVVTKYFSEPKTTGITERPFIPNSSSFTYYRPATAEKDYRKIYVNFGITDVYKDCYEMSEVRTIYNFSENLEAYSCFDLNVLKKEKISPNKLMIDYLKKTYPEIEATVVKRNADSCYVFEKIEGAVLKKSQSKVASEAIRGNYFNGKKTTLNRVCFFLEEQIRMPVENLVDYKYYDIEFEFHNGDIGDLNMQLAYAGLKLTLKKSETLKYLLFRKQVVRLSK